MVGPVMPGTSTHLVVAVVVVVVVVVGREGGRGLRCYRLPLSTTMELGGN